MSICSLFHTLVTVDMFEKFFFFFFIFHQELFLRPYTLKDPQHHTSSAMLNYGRVVLYHIFIPCTTLTLYEPFLSPKKPTKSKSHLSKTHILLVKISTKLLLKPLILHFISPPINVLKLKVVFCAWKYATAVKDYHWTNKYVYCLCR